jgi:hypothetical protein
MYRPLIYGSAMNIDSRGNIRVPPDAAKIAYRWIASQASPVTGFRHVQRGGSGYSLGGGGTYRYQHCADDGTGKPGTVLATSNSFSPGNPSGDWERVDSVTFPSPYTTVIGTTYHIVGENIGSSPSSNYISFNEVFRFGTPLNPRQPAYTDDCAIYELDSGVWGLSANHTPVFEVIYGNGQFDGQGYQGIIIGSHGNITGTTTMVRERFTVTGGDRTATQLWWRLGRQSGTDLVKLRLETGTGVLIEESDAADSGTTIPVHSPGATYSGDWCHITFGTPRVLTNGSTYNVRASCPSGSTYWSMPITSGIFPTGGNPAQYNWASRHFGDGTGQKTINSGGTWSALYAYLPENNQFYFVLQ